MNSASRYLVPALLLLAFTGGGIFLYLAVNPPTLQHATLLPEPARLPEFTLVDQSGQDFTRRNLEGRAHLVFFGFTHCPDICPATLQQLAIARTRVEDAGGEFPEVLLVSVDPDRDSPSVLADYTGHFGNGTRGITGDIGEIRKLTSALGVFFQKSGDPDGDYTVDHSAAVLFIDRNGAWRALFGAPHNIDYFVHDVPMLMDAS